MPRMFMLKHKNFVNEAREAAALVRSAGMEEFARKIESNFDCRSYKLLSAIEIMARYLDIARSSSCYDILYDKSVVGMKASDLIGRFLESIGIILKDRKNFEAKFGATYYFVNDFLNLLYALAIACGNHPDSEVDIEVS